jgi:cytochrome c5
MAFLRGACRFFASHDSPEDSMTAAHEPNEIDGPHEGPIKTPKQLILAVLFAFVVPIVGIILLVIYVTAETRPGAGSAANEPKVITERIRPVGMVEIKDATDIASLKTGEQVYAAQCTACHGTGALNSPKLGDVAAWAPRLKAGFDTLLRSALAGKGQMPPQGGGDFTDYEIARAVVYIANQSGGKLAEPPAPVAGASGPAATTTTATAAAPATAVAAAAVTPSLFTAPATPAAPAAPARDAAPATTVAAAAAPPLYVQACGICHVAGVAGAPKLGDKAAWAPRIGQGMDALVSSVIKGKGAMPPRGGSTASDAELKSIVDWMVAQSK